MTAKKETKAKFATFDDMYQVDEELSTEGVPIEWGFNAKDQPIKLFIAEAGNKNHQKARRKYEKALERSRKNKSRYELIMAKIVAEGVLVNWENILDSNGKTVPATIENKVAALDKYERLFIDVLEIANNPENFRPVDADDAEEETEGNSETSSDGQLNTEDT